MVAPSTWAVTLHAHRAASLRAVARLVGAALVLHRSEQKELSQLYTPVS